jgi:hypothetical protein
MSEIGERHWPALFWLEGDQQANGTFGAKEIPFRIQLDHSLSSNSSNFCIVGTITIGTLFNLAYTSQHFWWHTPFAGHLSASYGCGNRPCSGTISMR